MKSIDPLSFDKANAPLPIKWLNVLARITRPASDRLLTLQKENLLKTAERQTGLRDWGDARFHDYLCAMLNSVIEAGKLSFFGRFAVRQFWVENLSTRLRIIEVLKRFPVIQTQPVQRPIFITGWYRSGTTYLHDLLASHPGLRAPLLWELRHPCPTLDPQSADPRRQIRKVRVESRFHRWLAPGFNDIHPMAAEKAEECLHLFEKACAGTTAFVISEAKSFAWWLLEQGLDQGYQFFKIQLQLLDWLRPGRRWVLKWPYHRWHLDTLFKTFPDADVIDIHRDPREAIPSVCSLAAAARAPFCEQIDTKGLGHFWLDYCEEGLKRSKNTRNVSGNDHIMDIRYPDLIQNPASVLSDIQKFLKLDSSESWFNSLRKSANKKTPQKHRYKMDQFGLNPEEIRERFHHYLEDYNLSN
jgi:hypothetical protein